MVKPAISAGGRSSARFDAHEPTPPRALVARIHADGRTAMVQPFLGERDEKALVYIDGAVLARRPAPRAAARSGRPRRPLPRRGPRAPEATRQEQEIAEEALACAPAALLYGRVDLMGEAVLELEIAEPSLYLAFADGAAGSEAPQTAWPTRFHDASERSCGALALLVTVEP